MKKLVLSLVVALVALSSFVTVETPSIKIEKAKTERAIQIQIDGIQANSTVTLISPDGFDLFTEKVKSNKFNKTFIFNVADHLLDETLILQISTNNLKIEHSFKPSDSIKK
jgi:hypothetical protein